MTRTPQSSNGPRLALVSERDLPPVNIDEDPDAIPTSLFERTDTAVTFAGHIDKMAFDKHGNLQVVLTVDPTNPISNVDIAPLRHRLVAVTLEPRRRARSGELVADSPEHDPITAGNIAARAVRMIERWVDEWDDEDLARDAMDEWVE